MLALSMSSASATSETYFEENTGSILTKQWFLLWAPLAEGRDSMFFFKPLKLQSEHPSAFAKFALMVGCAEITLSRGITLSRLLRAQIESSGATNIRLVEERRMSMTFTA